VVVVDNASDDDSVAIAEAIPGVTVIANSANVGFGRACNVGASLAPPTADLLFLNPDARIDPVELGRLAATLDAHPECGLVAPRLFRGATALTSSGDSASVLTELRAFAPRFLALRLPDRRHPPDTSRDGDVAYVEGACMLVRRTAFDNVSGFDPDFFLFFEELDLGNRLRHAGWSVRTASDIRAEHEVAASRASTPDNARPALVESTVRYLVKWHGRRRALAYVALVRMLWRVRVLRNQLGSEEQAAYRRAVTRAWRSSIPYPRAVRATSLPRRAK